MNNTVLVFDMILRGLEWQMKLQETLRRAQAEGRDVTDEELQALQQSNTDAIEELLRR